jgi:predicted DNA helicase
VLGKRHFRTVIIDEAAQALEPATWIPILRAGRVVLTGDPFQLPPTIKSHEARRGGLEVTLIEKALQRQSHTSLLRTQYRMHETIMNFSNHQFYAGELEAAPQVAQTALAHDTETPVVFIDTAGTDFQEQVQPNYQSKYNEGEFNILLEHLYALLEHCDSYMIAPLPSIALISPYREQVMMMKKLVKEDARLIDVPITINTIDGFQGQERDVVYISLVRSNAKTEIGFLKDYRRMNVAMTRARHKLVIVGDSATIGNDKFYTDFLEYCEAYGTYRTAWEFMA